MNRHARAFIMLLPLLWFLISSGNIYALMVKTHSTINENIVANEFNGFYLDSYLKSNLNIDAGIQEPYEGYAGLFDAFKMNYSIKDWIKFGGELEDTNPSPEIYARSYNHFHDPTKPLDQAGFSDKIYGMSLHSGVSSILWALSKDAQSSAPGLGDYSWFAARQCFYNALTATDEDSRNHNFAKCFRSVGQLMHLVEDASVPEHTRNEAHPFGYHYEVYVNNKRNSSEFNTIMANPVIPYTTVLSKPGNSDPRIDGLPVSRLFDTGNYSRTGDPAITVATGIADIGLAEYTNANFFSRRSAMKYDYPKKAVLKNVSSTVNGKKRYYYGKDGDGEHVEHLAAKAYFDYEFKEKGLQNFYDGSIFLDENCYKDYATKLLPRAEGYAFSLMQYFFRGQIDAVDPWETKDIKDDKLVVTGLTMKVKNSTPGEGMTNAAPTITTPDGKTCDTLVVACRYKLAGDEKYYYVKSSQGTQADDAGNDQPLPVVLGCYSTTVKEVKFKFPDDTPVPYNAPVKEYMLVYRGKLGAEDDAVAAKSFTAGTPTVIDNWNAAQNWMTDKPSLVTLSRDTASPLEGQGMLKIDIAGGDLCDVMREVLPSESGAYMSIGRSVYSCGGYPCNKGTPSIVAGTDNKSYRCIQAHTSSDDDRPVTGKNSSMYWVFNSDSAQDGETWGPGTDYNGPFLYYDVGYNTSGSIGQSLDDNWYGPYKCFLSDITLRLRGAKSISAGRCWIELNCQGNVYNSQPVEASSLKTDGFDDVTFHFDMFPMYTWYSSFKLTGDDAFLNNLDYGISKDTFQNCDKLKGCGNGPAYHRVQVMIGTSEYSGPGCGQKAHSGSFAAKDCSELDPSRIPFGDLDQSDYANGLAYKIKGFDQFNSSIAYFGTSRNCSKKKYVRFAVKSHITGSPLVFRYGNQDYYAGGMWIDVVKPDTWEIKTIDISALPEAAKAKMNNWGFGWGPDSYDSATGRSKANTIYIDMLDSEGTSVTPEPPPPPPCPDCPPPPPT